jgi:hypothetical protein
VVWFGNSISNEIEANGVTSVNGGPLPVELVRAPYAAKGVTEFCSEMFCFSFMEGILRWL